MDVPVQYVPLGYQQVSPVSGGAAGLPSIPAGATAALITVETAAIRWRDDGTAPTASVGVPIAAAAAPFFYTGNLSAFKYILQTGAPVLNVSYYRAAG